MLLVFLGAISLVASIALKAGPQFANEKVQLGLAIVFVVAAIYLLFQRRSNPLTGSNKTRDVFIGFSVLIPVAVTAWLYNSFIAILLGPDKLFEGVYSFLLWVVLVLASLQIWGQILRLAGIISAEEAQSLRTWRAIKQKQSHSE